MFIKIKVTPKFDTSKIIDEGLNKYWFEFQTHAFNMGDTVLKYMQNYIGHNHKRKNGKGNLADSIELFKDTNTTGRIFWGIGHIPTLNEKAPHWYVINFGKKVTGELFRPNNGKFVPGFFGDGEPKSNLKGQGTEPFFLFHGANSGIEPGIIRPMHYIETAREELEQHLSRLLTRLRRS